MALSITTQDVDNGVQVTIDGEVDVSNADEVGSVLDDLIADGPEVINVDLSEVPYIDSTGIGVLVGVAHRITENGGELVVSRPQPNVLRVLTLLGVGSEFSVTED